MIFVFVGHRGTGKTCVLDLIKKFFKQKSTYWDLDAFIEKSEGISVDEIFSKFGETNFRQLEKIYLNKILDSVEDSEKKHHFISLGAGFQGDIPEGVSVIWVKRSTDVQGRVFLNRPRLNIATSPLQEYLERVDVRNKRYEQIYTECLHLPEGHSINEKQMGFFFKDLWTQHGNSDLENWSLTLKPENFRNSQFKNWVKKRLLWGVGFFELRDDLLDLDQMEQAIQEIPRKKLLFSFRKPNEDIFHAIIEKDKDISDWALELGTPPDSHLRVLSLHERKETLVKTIKYLESFSAAHYKLAIEIQSFEELLLCHNWWQADPVNRSFLPRSKNGRWEWYRRVWGSQMLLNFFREDQGSSEDQPYLLDLIHDFKKGTQFAAIMGDPVQHSWTPSEQQDFFYDYSMRVVRVPLSEVECTRISLSVLQELGLCAAAVTSPLKNKMYQLFKDQIDLQAVHDLKSVNTIFMNGDKWRATNTDLLGLEKQLEEVFDNNNVAVWGGGGTASSLKKVLSEETQFYSARTGELKEPKEDKRAPEVLVWAVGRTQMDCCQWPPENWNLKKIIDLNYSENSPGKEWALLRGVEYVSGEIMFKEQAKYQREFWQSSFKKYPLRFADDIY